MKIQIDPTSVTKWNTFSTLTRSSNLISDFLMASKRLGLLDPRLANKMAYAVVNAFAQAMRKPPVLDADTRYVHVNILPKDEYEINRKNS